MTNKLQLARPLDSLTSDIVRKIQQAAATLDHRPLLVGATARIILLEHVFALPTGRATKDIDFAFAMDTWEQFDTLKRHLVEQHGFGIDEHVSQRLYYREEGARHGIPVDLVPFGALGGQAEEIRWPPDMAIVMNVAGFADALASAVHVEIAPGLDIAIASLPAIAVLKLFAWLDRHQETSKDATDLTALMRVYHEVDQDRVYTVPSEVLADVGYDIELGGAWLLGNDARRMALPATVDKLDAVLADTARTERLANDMARKLPVPDPDAHAAHLLTQFKKGFGTT